MPAPHPHMLETSSISTLSPPYITHIHSPVQLGQTAAVRQSCRRPAMWMGTPGSVLQLQENHPLV